MIVYVPIHLQVIGHTYTPTYQIIITQDEFCRKDARAAVKVIPPKTPMIICITMVINIHRHFTNAIIMILHLGNAGTYSREEESGANGQGKRLRNLFFYNLILFSKIAHAKPVLKNLNLFFLHVKTCFHNLNCLPTTRS